MSSRLLIGIRAADQEEAREGSWKIGSGYVDDGYGNSIISCLYQHFCSFSCFLFICKFIAGDDNCTNHNPSVCLLGFLFAVEYRSSAYADYVHLCNNNWEEDVDSAERRGVVCSEQTNGTIAIGGKGEGVRWVG